MAARTFGVRLALLPYVADDKRVEDISTLARNPLLAPLGVQELGTFLDVLEQVSVPQGTLMVEQGRDNDYAYFVLEGQARVSRSGSELASLGPGDSFGELALASQRASTASVEATMPMRLARLSRSRYAQLATTRPGLALHLAQTVSMQLAEQLASSSEGLVGGPNRLRARRKEVTVRSGGSVTHVPTGTPIQTLLPDGGKKGRIVGALLDNRPVSLETPVVCDATVAPIPIAAPEGREIFMRSVGLLVLEAAAQVAPETRCRWGPTLGPAQVVEVDADVPPDLAALSTAVEQRIRSLIEQNVPFREHVSTLEEARHQFLAQGWAEAAALLRTQRDPTITLVSCGTIFAPSMGPVLRSARDIGHVRVLPHAQGLLVDLEEHLSEYAPGRHHDTRIDPITQEARVPRFGGEMAEAHRAWLATLGVQSVGHFNDACVSGRMGELIRVSEGFHEKRIGQIADAIASRRSTVKIIRIAGPSSSGKTTFIKRLTVQLEIDGMHPVNLSIDDYYVDRERTPVDERGEYDFEAVEAIDRALLQRQVTELLEGRRIKVARYDFRSGRSLPSGGPELALTAGDVLVLEGLHGLNPDLLDSGVRPEQKFGIFIHPATTIPFDRLNGVATEDLRLLRRIVRDRHARGYSAADNIVRWPSVRRGEQFHVFPCEPFADAVFDSSLVYELSVFKVFADRYLLEVPQDHLAFPTALRLRNLVDRFVGIYPEHVPPTSVLREFIGGSGFEY